MILLTKSPGSSKSFQEAPKKLQKNQGRNPEIISLVFCKALFFGRSFDTKRTFWNQLTFIRCNEWIIEWESTIYPRDFSTGYLCFHSVGIVLTTNSITSLVANKVHLSIGCNSIFQIQLGDNWASFKKIKCLKDWIYKFTKKYVPKFVFLNEKESRYWKLTLKVRFWLRHPK